MSNFVPLTNRAVVAITGEDRVSFLDALVTNSLAPLEQGLPVYTAFLTPQGKYLFDFTVVADGDRLMLDVEGARAGDLIRRLSLYKLRAKAALALQADLGIIASPGGPLPGDAGAVRWRDPRHPNLGERAIVLLALRDTATLPPDAYHAHRYRLGIPEGSIDLPPEKALLMESGFDELHGVAWDKGCYIGQELTARTKYKGLVKRRLVPVLFDGEAPAPGTPLFSAGKDAGDMRGGIPGIGLALVRLEHLTASLSTAEGLSLTTAPPSWLRLPS